MSGTDDQKQLADDRQRFWQSLTPEEQAVMREAREIFGEGFNLMEVEWK